MSDSTPRLGILYEHPDWFRPLFAELDRRDLPYEALRPSDLVIEPGVSELPFTLLLNRMSPSAGTRGGADQVFFTGRVLEHAALQGIPVINGSRAWAMETSKASQLALLDVLGLPYPRARVIHRAEDAARAARGLRFPVVTKPNVGGSGAGIVRFDTEEALESGIEAGQVDLGLDHTALVQEFIPARDGYITRVEILDGRFLYAIRVFTTGDEFNLCPADICQTTDGATLVRGACPVDAPSNSLQVEVVEPPPEVIEAVERIARRAGIQVGGVEVMVDDRDGTLLYYDVNALSNFVADPVRVLGFDPFVRMVDWLEAELFGAFPRGRAVIHSSPEEFFHEEGCHITEWRNAPEDPEASLARARVEPGSATRWHRLEGVTERYIVLEGRGIVEVGDRAPEPVGPGSVVHIPPGVRQRIRNDGEGDLIFLALCTPRFTPDCYEAL